MKCWKRLMAIALSLILCMSLLAGCAEEERSAGLALSVCVGSVPDSLDPIYAEEIGDQSILVHLYENLLRVMPDGEGGTTVTGGMAKDIEREENHDGTVTYTFRLRSAKWSDGKSVRASDFVYAWRRLASPSSNSPYAALLSVVCGYDAARASGDMSRLQVTAKNDSTLVVVLDGNYDWFLTQVCTSPATVPLREDVVRRLKEAQIEAVADGEDAAPWWSDPVAFVTNGPYQVADYGAASLLATANERYYGDQLGPSEVTFHFADTPEEAQTLYDAKDVNAVWPLTEARLTELAADEEWTAIPQLGTYSVLFNCSAELFADPLIREAMNLVIDRNALAQEAGVLACPAEGLVPHGVPENEEGDFRTVGGPMLDNDPERYAEYCEQARTLLEDAGYDSGENLGELEYLYVDAGNNGVVASVLCQQWRETLGIRVTPKGVAEWELWAALRSGEYILAGVDLEAPGNDAECFLAKWTSDSQDNVVHYQNSAYDTLMSIIASAPDGTARAGCLHDAEELLLADHVLAPLFVKGTDWDLRDTLTGAFRDPRGWFCFSNTMTKPL